MSTTPAADDHSGENVLGTEQWERTTEALNVLGQWRARVDELRVQLDLAKLDLRDRASHQVEVASNASLAATSKLRDTYRDARVNAEALRDGVDELVHDLKEVYEAVESVLSRG